MDENAFKDINRDLIKLDFTGCKDLGEIHKVLKDTFGFPEYYGENWSALWDCLRSRFDHVVAIEIYGLNTLPKEFTEQVEIMIRIFKRVENNSPNMYFIYIS